MPKNQTKRSAKKSAKVTVPVAVVQTESIVTKLPRYRSFLPRKRVKYAGSKLPGAFRLLGMSLRTMKDNWKFLGGILLVHALLTIALVRGLGGLVGLTEMKATIEETLGGEADQVATGLALFGELLGSAGATVNEAASVYQTFLVIIVSLALIWALRQIYASDNPASFRVRDAFYKGQYPLVPFVLILLVISLQLLPLAIGSSLYNLVSSGIATSGLEQGIWLLLFALLAVWSFYMLSSSLFALYVVTLPDMTPMKALRSARQLVRHRRWTIMRKVAFLPLALFVVAAAVLVPIIIVVAPLAEWLFFAMTVLGLGVGHSYMYTLYRELL